MHGTCDEFYFLSNEVKGHRIHDLNYKITILPLKCTLISVSFSNLVKVTRSNIKVTVAMTATGEGGHCVILWDQLSSGRTQA